MQELNDRPILVQGNADPIAEGVGDEILRCAQCGHPLAVRYEPYTLIAIQIECNKCSGITLTPEWPFNWPLPNNVFLMEEVNSARRMAITQTLRIPKGGAFTCAAEAKRVSSKFGSRDDLGVGVLDEAKLESTKLVLDEYTDGKLSWAIEITRRAQRSGNAMFLSFPLAWAFCQLEGCLAKKTFHMGSADGVAVNIFHLSTHLAAKWAHHPLFKTFAAGFVTECYHTLAMLVAASYIEQERIRVGFAAPDAGRWPDLFVDVSRSERVSIEVKAPRLFQWPNPTPSSSRMEMSILKQLKEAKRQVNGSAGLAVIGTASNDPDLQARFKEAVQSLMLRGKISSVFAGVIGVHLSSHAGIAEDNGNPRVTGGANVDPIPNPKYQGTKFLVLGDHEPKS